MRKNRVVVVCDSHLYHSQNSQTDALFHEFLRRVPDLGDHLVIAGDLFEFWFEYRSVIPSQLFPTLTLLAELRTRGVQLTVTGGNHDRWGGTFWREHLGARFEPDGCELDLVGMRATVMHGDGLLERHPGARVLHWITRRKLTASTFRLLHPDLGIWAVKKMSRALGHGSRSEAVTAQAAAIQEAFARKYLASRPDVRLLVMGHTHRAVSMRVGDDQWYLNPGPWMDETRYATVSADGPELHVFAG